jgi:acyl carrier protein
MTTPTTEQRVVELIQDYTDSDVPVARDCRLGDDLGLDSLDMVELVVDLEDAFDTAISDEEFDRWSTVGDVIDFIERIV